MYGKLSFIFLIICNVSYAIAATSAVTIYPTPLVYTHHNSYFQRIIIQSNQEFEGEIIASIDGVITKKIVSTSTTHTAIDCKRNSIGAPSQLKIIIRKNNAILAQKMLHLPPVKKWNIYCVPFAHVDIGFTQSQKNIRVQNLSNIDIHLSLCEKTQKYPRSSRFKLFTEVSWPVIEYLYDKEISQASKDKLINQLQKGNFELGAFVISHQNRFMSPYALLASLHHTLRLAQKYSITVKTACIHDVMDFSKLPKILSANNIAYCLVGPNDARYIVPPLFYLASPDGSAKVLVWHTVGLNGYGENFDLNMRLSLPFKDVEFSTMENSIALHLAQLENGYPTQELTRYYNYEGAHWDYPYDAYLLPYYPSQGGDNQPQTIVPSEIAKTWNQKFINPKIIIATPKEFFEYVSEKYNTKIPVIKGDMPPFWGEQIYLDFIQVDPERLSINYWYDYAQYARGIDTVQSLLLGKPANVNAHITKSLEGYMAIILNNDHNPRPVPFGKTHYTKQDVKDWMDTRNQWVYTPINIMKDIGYVQPNQKDAKQWKLFDTTTNPVIIENVFYRIAFNKNEGCISSIYDKQLHKEWVNNKHQYGFNQYVIGIRGENAATRNYFESVKGFKHVTSAVYANNNNDYRIVVEGSERSYYKGMEILSEFFHRSFGVKLPPTVLKIIYFFYQLFTPSVSVTQEIIIPAAEKRIDFIQHFKGKAPQIAEHYFAYPLQADELLYDSAFSIIKWGSLPKGDLIPAAKNIAPFKSINDTLYPFQWMYGLPTSFYCDNFVLQKDHFQYALLIPHNSKAIIPDSGIQSGFYHCCIGWSLWGKLGLGRNLPDTITFKSTFTSFTAHTKNEAIATAYSLSLKTLSYEQPSTITSQNRSVRVVYNQPLSENSIVVGMYEISGKEHSTALTVSTKRRIQAYYSDIKGKKFKTLNVSGNAIPLRLRPHELLFITIELL